MKSTGEERKRGWLIATAAGLGVALAAQSATAQYANDFEAMTLGVMTGQDAFYLPPAPALSVDYMVEEYPACQMACDFDTSTGPGVCDIVDFTTFAGLFAGGDPCACDLDTSTGPGVCDIVDFTTFAGQFAGGGSNIVPANPTGGNQYVRGVGPAGSFFARAQRDITWPTGVVTMSYDVLCGTENAGGFNNLGSFSIQPFPGSGSFIHLFHWMLGSATEWRASIIGFTALGAQTTFPPPGPEWENLALNKWYRLSITVDFALNEVTGASITDIDAGTTTTVPITGVFLDGGNTPPGPHPTGFRFFAGTNTAGNYVAWDNCDIQ